MHEQEDQARTRHEWNFHRWGENFLNSQAKTKKRRYASVIFDLDGTILDRPSNVPREANLTALKLLCPMKYDIATLKDELKRVYTLTTQKEGFLVTKRKQFTLLLKNLGISANNLVERLFQEFLRRYLSLVDLFPDAVETLTALSGLGLRIGLATNGPEDLVNEVIEHFNLHDVFDFIVTPSQVGSPKPSRQYSDFLMEQARIDPHEILVVGDGEEDRITAEMIGARFILVYQGQHTIHKKTNSFRIVQNLSEIVAICLNLSRTR
jgi:HAD superfamily hydrolase (TIGR01549 family)